MTDKKELCERGICTKYIAPSVEAAGWDIRTILKESFDRNKTQPTDTTTS